MKRERTAHTLRSPKIPEALRFAVAADIHSAPYEDVLEDLLACDAVLIPGDLIDRHRRNNSLAWQFLREVPKRPEAGDPRGSLRCMPVLARPLGMTSRSGENCGEEKALPRLPWPLHSMQYGSRK